MVDTRYALTPDGFHIAYQVVGDGPVDVLFSPWWWSHVEAQWDDVDIAGFLEGVASFARLIVFDHRGIGMSDPVSTQDLPTLERWVDDAVAVLDAAASDSAVVVGHGDGGSVAMLLAAANPERVEGLVLIDSFARYLSDIDYDGFDPAVVEAGLEGFPALWGTGGVAYFAAPDRAGDDRFRERLGRLERHSASPGIAVAMQRVIAEVDVRAVLPALATPALVVHHRDNFYVPVALGRYLSDHITDARYVELAGSDHLYWLDQRVLSEIEEFVTGSRTPVPSERILATVVFTDIVASTEHATRLGDHRWRTVLSRYDDLVHEEVSRHRGRVVKSTGDGSLAVFDGPARAVLCAQQILDKARNLGIELRAGAHTGEIEVLGDDIAGITVHTAARVAALAAPNETLVSRTVVDLVAGSNIHFHDRGEHTLKGLSTPWQLYAIDNL